MWLSMTLLMTLLAVGLERMLGYPDALWRAIGHPVSWIGRMIAALELRLNFGPPRMRRRRGRGALAILLAVVLAVSLMLSAGAVVLGALGVVLLALLASSLIAQRSLAAHVLAVAEALEQSEAQGRAAVAMIVGRDVAALDEAGIARAAIESLAENFSDGVVAPIFWMALGGVPAAAAYKAINTADSMIGHRNERYVDFGRAAARLDDWVNWPAAKLSALLLAAAALLMPGASARAAWTAMRADARCHASPNAGWPEAAMAGALGISLAGPRSYQGVMVDHPALNPAGRRALGAGDIRLAIMLYWRADAVLFGLLAVLWGAAALALA